MELRCLSRRNLRNAKKAPVVFSNSVESQQQSCATGAWLAHNRTQRLFDTLNHSKHIGLLAAEFNRGGWLMAKIPVFLFWLVLLLPTSASAWNAPGHKVVGSIADQLLNANAKRQVAQILGFDLSTAGPWLDCVKSVEKQDDGSFVYKEDPRYEPPCTPFKLERSRMEDYAKRNWFDCSYMTGSKDRGCHNTYHFADIAVQCIWISREISSIRT
jgi:hypothetical protein